MPRPPGHQEQRWLPRVGALLPGDVLLLPALPRLVRQLGGHTRQTARWARCRGPWRWSRRWGGGTEICTHKRDTRLVVLSPCSS